MLYEVRMYGDELCIGRALLSRRPALLPWFKTRLRRIGALRSSKGG